MDAFSCFNYSQSDWFTNSYHRHLFHKQITDAKLNSNITYTCHLVSVLKHQEIQIFLLDSTKTKINYENMEIQKTISGTWSPSVVHSSNCMFTNHSGFYYITRQVFVYNWEIHLSVQKIIFLLKSPTPIDSWTLPLNIVESL